MLKSYWNGNYGFNRSRDFIEGVIAGLTALAVWRDGGQFVGTLSTPLEEAIAEVKRDLGWKAEWDET